MEPVNILCMKWGTMYNADYVNRLYSMVARNLTLPFRFVCFTNDEVGIRDEVEVMPLPEIPEPEQAQYSPSRKLSMFRKDLGDLQGKALFLDLDLLIVDNIDAFFKYSNELCIIENWSQMGRGIGNSSVYCFEIGKYHFIFDNYSKNPVHACDNFDNEQVFLSRQIGDKLVFWPEQWCKSFKRHCLPKGIMAWFKTPTMPYAAKIIVFHGNPKPHEAAIGKWPGRILKHVRPTPWIYKYWQ